MAICVTLYEKGSVIRKLFFSDVSSVFVGPEFVNIVFIDGTIKTYIATDCKIGFGY